MKGCSTSYVTRAWHVKTMLRYHCIHIKMAKLRNTDNIKCWKLCGVTETLMYHCWECKMIQPCWRTFGSWQLLIRYTYSYQLSNHRDPWYSSRGAENLHIGVNSQRCSFKKIYYLWMHQVFVMALKIFPCSTWFLGGSAQASL